MAVDTRPSRRTKAGKGQKSKAWADDDFDAAIKDRGEGINFAGLWELAKTIFASKSYVVS
jgi:hypothetical protein